MSFPNTVTLSYGQIIKTTAVQKAPLGVRGVTTDGRVFRYAKNGATALAVGMGVTPPAALDLAFATTAGRQLITHQGTTWKTSENVVVITGSGGAVGAAADYYKEGYLVVGSTQARGVQFLKLKSHSVITAGDTCQHITITLEDGVFPTSNINSSQSLSMIKSPWDSVIVQTTEAIISKPIVGITPIDVPASEYFWSQTGGLGIVLMCEACSSCTALGRAIVPSMVANTTGFASQSSCDINVASSGNVLIGTLVSGCAAGNYAVVNLIISP